MPLPRIRQPTEDIIDRVIQRLKIFSLCIVKEVKPHKLPYPADPYFDVCDIKLKDIRDPKYKDQKFVSCLVLQRQMGNLTGHNWMPSQGDLVMVAWLDNEKPVIIGQLYSVQQEAIVKPTSDDFYQDIIEKYTQPESPDLDDDLNPEYMPVPAERDNPTCQPVCRKQFAGNRDQMQVWECPHGVVGDDPTCMDCVNVNYPITAGVDTMPGTMIRYVSKETVQPDRVSGRDTAKGEIPRRFQILHHSGSELHFDEDGTVQLESALAQTQQGHILFKTDSTIEIKNHLTNNVITIEPNGKITITASSEIELNAPVLDVNCSDNITVNATNTITITAPEITLDGRTYTD